MIKVYADRANGEQEVGIFENLVWKPGKKPDKKLPMRNNLISMLDNFSGDWVTCFVFPLYGTNVKEVLKRNKITTKKFRTIANQLIKATKCLHNSKMLHTDI